STRMTDLSGNPRRFILFTVFYNARAYYPVLAILFLDLGLTLDQFVLLNLIWAATIFLFEVPSGALADTIGRKKLLVAASVLMVVEMSCLLLAPRNGGAMLLALCVINRVCSGLSEACASGADEALAYDSLPENERAGAWDKLLATTMRWRSVGFVIAMVLGGLLYDPVPLNRLLPASLHLSVDLAQRLPVAIVLCQALVCLAVSLRMVEPPRHASHDVGGTFRSAFKLTLETARWVFTNPKTLVVVVIGLTIDSIVRNFATITSSYYRLIELPEWTYGFIGAALGLLGWFVPGIATRLNQRFSTLGNLGIAAGVALAGLAALSPAWSIYGVLPAMLLMTLMGYLGFTVSRALHAETDSAKRATVLSVKGLAFNLGYGLFSLGFSRLLAHFPDHPAGDALRSALTWQVPAFAAITLALFAWGTYLRQPNR
ncbi:MAG: MFS transporter, partial [Akkermansiaceae bacterium]